VEVAQKAVVVEEKEKQAAELVGAGEDQHPASGRMDLDCLDLDCLDYPFGQF